MGFLEFLGGAAKILVGGAVCFLCLLAASSLLVQGEGVIAVILFGIAFVAGLYAQYQWGQQRSRMLD